MSNLPYHIGVHVSHCCVWHECKYGDEDCPVALGTHKQESPCEYCDRSITQDKIERYFLNNQSEFEKWAESQDQRPTREECWDAALEALLNKLHEKESSETDTLKRYSYVDIIQIAKSLQ
jgi:hypothetical protein